MTDAETITNLLGDIATLECRLHNAENRLAASRFWGDVYSQQNQSLKGDVELLTAKNIVLQHSLDEVTNPDIVVS